MKFLILSTIVTILLYLVVMLVDKIVDDGKRRLK